MHHGEFIVEDLFALPPSGEINIRKVCVALKFTFYPRDIHVADDVYGAGINICTAYEKQFFLRLLAYSDSFEY